MKPAAFAYRRPALVPEAVGLLAAHGDEAKVLAGGQSLVPALNLRLARPSVLVDINRLAELSEIRAGPAGVAIGALVRHATLAASPLVRERLPLLAEAARHIGHHAIRNRGTLGGSLAHADPAAELPAAAAALGARLVAVGPTGVRELDAEALCLGPYLTGLAPDELLTEVRLPNAAPPATGWGFAEVARRPGDFAIAGVAAILRPAPSDPGRCGTVRLFTFGVGDAPVRLGSAEAELAFRPLDAGTVAKAGRAAAADCDPRGDLHASAAYRRHLVTVLVERAVADAAVRLRAGADRPTAQSDPVLSDRT